MITRTQVRDKIDSLLEHNEYKRQYFDSDGTITGATSDRDNISVEARSALMVGYFNKKIFITAKNVTIVIVEASKNNISSTHYNEIPSGDDLLIAMSAGFSPELEVTEQTVAYNADIHGAPSGDGVQVKSFSIESSGDFFGDLNTFSLVAAATYELANDQITILREELKALGIEVI